ncbi:hypothetical protein G5714_009954 [Onychostoma macrolepis]|uniref:Secreted protein n=1 Tax=Onychostoma macrolepis TaxID=369639 RepID=A0A7J6CNX4_9TELE|nr:hypothetical protein G5714_009954 [Onychostoma macrolepis]
MGLFPCFALTLRLRTLALQCSHIHLCHSTTESAQGSEDSVLSVGVRNCRMSAGTAGDVLWVFIKAAAQTRYIQKQLVPSIQPKQEQVGLSRLTAPSLTQPLPYGPQQPERRLCQNCVTHKD